MLLLLFCLFATSMAMTDHKITGNETSSRRSTLIFEISSKPGMHCFYEHFNQGSKFRVTYVVINQQLQHLHMRISSPTDIISEWFEGIDRVEHTGEAPEPGDYEVCVTAKVGYANIKVLLELFTYSPEVIERSFKDYMEKNNIQKSIVAALERVFEKSFNIFYSLRIYNFHSKRDTHLQEKNMNYIDAFSSLQTVFMIGSALTQVYLIRKFFYIDPKRIRI